jgi:ketosteroid isomerase-like protein
LDGYRGAVDMGIRDLHVLAGDDFADACRFSRVRGTLKNGHQVGSWVRATSTCQRSNERWVITHEHVSLPVDLKSGRPAMDLVP